MSCNQPCQQNNQQNQRDDSCKVSPPKRQVERLRDPTPPPIIKREVKRNPTPQGDTIERVRVTRQPQTIIERVIEQPRKPAPKIIERTEAEPCQPPIIKNICVFVDPSPKVSLATPCGCGQQPSPCSTQAQSQPECQTLPLQQPCQPIPQCIPQPECQPQQQQQQPCGC